MNTKYRINRPLKNTEVFERHPLKLSTPSSVEKLELLKKEISIRDELIKQWETKFQNIKVVNDKLIQEVTTLQIQIKNYSESEKSSNNKIIELVKAKNELEKYREMFKEYLIKDFLHRDLETFGKEPLVNILHLVELRKKDLKEERQNKITNKSDKEEILEEFDKDEESESFDFPNQNLRNPAIDFEDEGYIHSEKCWCGNSKRYGSKQCEICSKRFDKVRNRHGISLEEARKRCVEGLDL